MPEAPVLRGIFAVDIEGSGRHVAPMLVELREGLREILRRALAGSIPEAHFVGDLGDGVLVAMPPDSILALLDTAIPRLVSELRHRNRAAAADAQLRVRAAVHRGYVLVDEGTIVASDVHFLFRLLNAEILRACLGATSKPLAVIVSDLLYREVIEPDFGDVDPADFTDVRVRTKELERTGGGPVSAWAWVPEDRLAVERALDRRPSARHFARRLELRARMARLGEVVRGLGRKAADWAAALPPRWRLLLASAVVLALAGALIVPALRRPSDCRAPLELRVATTGSKLALLDELKPHFEDWARDARGCLTVNLGVFAVTSTEQVIATLSGGWPESELVDSGPEPDVWWPDSSVEVERLRKAMDDANRAPVELNVMSSVASSPVVLAVTEPLANQLGWPDRQPGLDEFLRRAGRPPGEGGSMRLGRTNPLFSSAGLHATVALYAATLGVERLDAAALGGDHGAALHQTELAITPAGGEDIGALLCDLVSAGGAPLNAVLVPEQAVSAFNRGDLPGSPCDLRGQRPSLRAFYPAGLPSLDYPFVEMTRAAWLPPARAPTVHRAAVQLHRFLREDSNARRLLEASRYRTPAPGGALSRAVNPATEGILHNQPARDVVLPDRDTVQALLRHWIQARRVARVLLAMDVSASMRLDNRLGDAIQAALHATDQLSGTDEVGLWRFALRLGKGGLDYEELVPLGPGRDLVRGRPRVDAIEAGLGTLAPTSHGTGLYDVVSAGISHLRRGHDEGTNSALVVLTDAGRDNDPDRMSRDDLLATLEDQPTVPVFVVAIGAGNCGRFGLTEIATRSGGECLDTGGATVDRAFQRIAAVLLGSDV